LAVVWWNGGVLAADLIMRVLRPRDVDLLPGRGVVGTAVEIAVVEVVKRARQEIGATPESALPIALSV
jgi:hypothetical protein